MTAIETPAETTDKKQTVAEYILDLGAIVKDLKKTHQISETGAIKLIDVALGFQMAQSQLQQNQFPFGGFETPAPAEDEPTQEGN